MQLVYTQVAGKLREFIANIPTWGVPQKITYQELAALGFKSSNDRTILSVLKALEIIENDGKPTEHWQGLRDRQNAKPLLAHLIRQAYSDLFGVYPAAYSATDTQLKNFFASRSKAGERAVQMAIATFKALVSLADFSEEAILPADFVDMTPEPSQTLSLTPRRSTQGKAGLSLTINVNIDGSSTPETIEALFAGLKGLSEGNN